MTTDLRSWRCPHCYSTNVLREGAHDAEGRPRQVLEVHHMTGCPDYVDEATMPAGEYDTEGLRRLGFETDGLD